MPCSPTTGCVESCSTKLQIWLADGVIFGRGSVLIWAPYFTKRSRDSFKVEFVQTLLMSDFLVLIYLSRQSFPLELQPSV